MATIALATCFEWPEPRGDAPLRAALSARGHTVRSCAWNGSQAPFLHADAVILRGCWDYHQAPQSFLDWIARLEQAGVRLHNEPDIVRWNFEKSYLLELARIGIKTPETIAVTPDDHDGIEAIMREHGWTRAVRKPISGQSGHHVDRLDLDNRNHWQAPTMTTSKALLQEFRPDIGKYGETMLVFFAGRFSHAVRRVIPAGEWRSNSQYGSYREPCEVSNTVIEHAVLALSVFDLMPLYARVDGIVADGIFELLELELIEPELGFAEVPHAAERFARAIEAMLNVAKT